MSVPSWKLGARVVPSLCLLVLAGVVAGCAAPNEAPVAPAGSSALHLDQVPKTDSVVGGSWMDGDTTVTVLLVDPSENATYPIASVHRLSVRAGGVCVLDAPYGAQYWDTPCDARTEPFLITARTWADSAGHPAIEFQPALRFSPTSSNGRPSAELFIKDKSASENAAASIVYCSGKNRCVDEALDDASLATKRDAGQGYLYRRIKHFSGYTITMGRSDAF